VSVVAPGFADHELVPVGDWMPSRYTPTLTGTEEFSTDGDKLLAFAAAFWRTPEVVKFLADPWQVWLLRHILETYPADWPEAHLRGQLRYRQVVISIARQNGKSVLGALLAFYFLTMHVRGPRVVGLASIEGQARIVYDRVKFAVDNEPRINREVNATETRGIKLRNGTGIYQTLPAKEDSAQGEPVSGCLYDELHLGSAALWDAMVLGQRARRNSMLVGITTAGDDDSDLLIRLYGEGASAIAGDDERFGFFVWEAESAELTEANVIRANPAIACGRVDLATAMNDARKLWVAPRDKDGVLGRDRCIRYTLNLFVEGSSQAWANLPAWKASAGTVELEGARVFALARTDSWDWASITAAGKTAGGQLVSELVASLESPAHDQLLETCTALGRAYPGSTFALPRKTLRALGKAITEAGHTAVQLTAEEMTAALTAARSAIGRRAVIHAGDAIVNLQMAQARRDLDDGENLDAVLATAIGIHVADTQSAHVIQLF
jgi:hypothetical protein